MLKSQEFPIPVISVGNLTVGGTGKTPHVEYLVRILKDDYRVALLSRGYKRKTRGYVLAGDQSTSRDIGDEPYQIKKKFPNILVAVDKNRRRGIRRLLDLPIEKRPEVILLDDAYQHRYAIPSLSIVLTDINRLIYEDYLLPAGRLREPTSNIHRANVVVVTKCPQQMKPIDYRIIRKRLDLYPYHSLFFSSWQYGNLQPVFGKHRSSNISLDRLQKDHYSVLLLSGIANPKQLEEFIQEYISPADTITYPDHYLFSKADIRKIEKRFACLPKERKIVITTEKDAARLVVLEKLLKDELKKQLYYLPIEAVFKLGKSEQFKQEIIEHVRTFRRNRIMDTRTY